MRCSIFEALDAVDPETGVATLYTNSKGLKQMKEGNSFFIWTSGYAKRGDVAIAVFEKDLAADNANHAYCVDGLDAIEAGVYDG